MTVLELGDLLRALFEFFFSPLGLALLAPVVVGVALKRLFPQRRRKARSGSWRAQTRSTSRSYPTPFRSSYSRHRRRYDDESLGDIRDLSPDHFEKFVAGLFVKRGYEASIVGGDGDHGVDIVVTNPQGERELVQCKRWDRHWIGEPVVRDFYGAFMHDGQAVRGYIVTTSVFSDAARAWVDGKPIALIDGKGLVEAVRLIG